MLIILLPTLSLINPDNCTIFISNPNLAEKDIFLLIAYSWADLFSSQDPIFFSKFIEETSTELVFYFLVLYSLLHK